MSEDYLEEHKKGGRVVLIMFGILCLVSYMFTKMNSPFSAEPYTSNQISVSPTFDYGYRLGQEAHAGGAEKLWACSTYKNYNGDVWEGCEAGYAAAAEDY